MSMAAHPSFQGNEIYDFTDQYPSQTAEGSPNESFHGVGTAASSAPASIDTNSATSAPQDVDDSSSASLVDTIATSFDKIWLYLTQSSGWRHRPRKPHPSGSEFAGRLHQIEPIQLQEWAFTPRRPIPMGTSVDEMSPAEFRRAFSGYPINNPPIGDE